MIKTNESGVFWTGGSLNPARSFAPPVIVGFKRTQWIYWVGPIAGAILAVIIYKIIKALEYETANDDPEALPPTGQATALVTQAALMSPENTEMGPTGPTAPQRKASYSLGGPTGPKRGASYTGGPMGPSRNASYAPTPVNGHTNGVINEDKPLV